MTSTDEISARLRS